MIASWRGLAVAAAIAFALAVVVVVDAARTPASVDRALVPGFDPARATALTWERAGQPAVRAERVGDHWELRTPTAVPADAGAIGEVLAALRGARWHRRGEPRPTRTTLTVVAGSERHVLGIAGSIAGTDQSWIVDDGRGAVVDSWVARALDRDRLSLQVRRPLAEIGSARSITITGSFGPDSLVGAHVDLQIEGMPRQLVRPSVLLLDPGLTRTLERALRDVMIVRLPEPPLDHGILKVRVTWTTPAPAEVTIELGGSCPGVPELAPVFSTAGGGCIDRAVASAIFRAVSRLLSAPAALVDRRPIPLEPVRVLLADAVPLEISPPQVGDVAADSTRVAELLAALAAPAAVTDLPARRPTEHLVVTDRAGAAITLDLFAERVLARHGEPVALRPPPGAWNLLVRPSRELRDPTLWVEEPTTIAALAIDGISYRRGAIIGEWTRQPPGAIDAARVEAFAAQLAAPRALGFVEDGIAIAHRVTIEVTPPVGAATRHVLELGAARPSGCPARVGHDAVVLPAAVCTEVAALAKR